MKTCPKCGAQLADAEQFCNHCGLDLSAQTAPAKAPKVTASPTPASPPSPAITPLPPMPAAPVAAAIEASPASGTGTESAATAATTAAATAAAPATAAATAATVVPAKPAEAPKAQPAEPPKPPVAKPKAPAKLDSTAAFRAPLSSQTEFPYAPPKPYVMSTAAKIVIAAVIALPILGGVVYGLQSYAHQQDAEDAHEAYLDFQMVKEYVKDAIDDVPPATETAEEAPAEDAAVPQLNVDELVALCDEGHISVAGYTAYIIVGKTMLTYDLPMNVELVRAAVEEVEAAEEETVSCVEMTVSPSEIGFQAPNQTATLTITVKPEELGDQITVRSENTAVATVGEAVVGESGSATFTVTAVGAGNATLTVVCADMDSSASVVCTFAAPEAEAPAAPAATAAPAAAAPAAPAATQSEPAADLSGFLALNHTDMEVAVGDTFKLVLNSLTGSVSGVTWTSTAPAIVSVGSNGTVQGVSAGTATIVATYQGSTYRCYVRCTG